ncbi:MAG: prephenate dehydrogenase/arogenate dehydrogenase family protein [Desulfitobacterium hafniense]|nr:prephenate dehydrogenase/arogenate dehydrogenase family protein [Desulfitobacterium hafniense]
MEITRKSLSQGWLGWRTPRACVLGLGLIGGSWAGALHDLGWTVLAVDTDKDTLAAAKAKGWIQEGWTELPESVDVDLVVVALPLHVLKNSVEGLIGRINKGAIVTDVGSLKSLVCSHSKRLLEEGIFFIGGHPMTGSEKSGFSQSEPSLFKGYPYVLAVEGCPGFVTEELTKLLGQIGARVVFRRPEIHDMEVAIVSHVPHLLSVALALAAQDCSSDEYAPLELAGRSFRDLTRIAASSPELWQEILLSNSTSILKSLECCHRRLNELSDFIKAGDGERISEAFRKAALVREYL